MAGEAAATSSIATIGQIEIMRIMEMIPHRYPFLMIDRVRDVVLDVSAVGIKNVSINEPFFQGHFPTSPVMPGVLIIESMAQTAAVLVVATLGPDAEGKLVYFMLVDSARFRRPIVPGDQVLVQVTKLRQLQERMEIPGRGNGRWKPRRGSNLRGNDPRQPRRGRQHLDV